MSRPPEAHNPTELKMRKICLYIYLFIYFLAHVHIFSPRIYTAAPHPAGVKQHLGERKIACTGT